MGISIQTKACAGLVALVMVCGLFASPSASADTGSSARFIFAYDADDLESVEGRNALNARLSAEARKQCRREPGIGKSPATWGQCQNDLVTAVREALDNRMVERMGGCVLVALSDKGVTQQSCARVEYATNAALPTRAQ